MGLRGKKPEDVRGRTFDLLTVEGEGERRGGASTWACVCVCGGRIELPLRELKRPGPKNCGCQSPHETYRQRRAEIAQLHRDGFNCQVIGEQLGISRQRVHQILIDLGEKPEPRKKEIQPLTSEPSVL